MKKIINFWGKDGAVSADLFLMSACMGIIGTDDEIYMRNVGLSETDLKLLRSCDKYFKILFGKEANIYFQNIVFQAEGSLSEKYKNNELLSLGCKQNEISSDINKLINSDSSAGEIFFSQEDTKILFSDLPQNERIALINCGNPCNDGLSHVMIPKESAVPVNGCRYNVFSGPSASGVYSVSVPFPDIYGVKLLKNINISDVPEILEFMRDENKRAESDMFGSDSGFIEKNQKNIDFLENGFKSISKNNISNPYTDAIHFTDYICMKKPTVSATFINMKTDGRKFLAPDIVSGGFSITNFLNVLSIREIILRPELYNDGRIYSFGCESADKYNINILLDTDGIKAFIGFFVMAVIVSGVLRTAFSEKCTVELLEITEKWAVRKAGFLERFGIPQTPEKRHNSYMENPENSALRNEIIKYTDEFSHAYLYHIINSLREIDRVSEQSCILSGGLENISEGIVDFKNKYPALSDAETDIKRIITDICGISEEKAGEKTSLFLEEYKKDFPIYDKNSGAEKYFENILSYTMKKAQNFSGGVLI